MRQQPTVCVVVPVLNERDSIAQAIGSARQAGADNVIVADGGSNDGTLDVVTNLGCTVVTSPRGRGTQQNIGAKQRREDVLLFLHADCQIADESVQQIRDAVVNEDAVWGGFEQLIPADGRLFRWLEKGNSIRANRRRLVYGDQGIWVRREVFEEVGGFPDEPLMEDVVISDRLKRISPPRILAGPITVDPRRWKQNGVIRQSIANWIYFGLFRMGVSAHRLAKHYQSD